MEPGTVLADRFTVERLASSGGMGHVYRARDATNGELVALKVVQRGDAATAARFLREGRVLATLSHARVVRYVAHGVSPKGEAYLVMEWLDGEDLARRLRARELTLRESVTVVLQACEGLAAAHARGIVHRDLKPSNLFLVGGEVGALKLIDFGIVRLGEGSTELTQTGMLLGTPGYMAPEQLRGQKDVDARADVFALGSVLYRCLTGEGPFAGEDRVACLTRMLFDDAVPPRRDNPEIPEALEDLVMRMLHKRPDDRPKDAAAVLRALHAMDMPASRRSDAPRSRRDALTDSEQRVVSIVLTSPAPRAAPGQAGAEGELRRHVEALGLRLESLGNGAFAAIAAEVGAPADKAAQAARAALVMRRTLPDAPVAVATGLGDTSSRKPVGEVIERALALLRGPVPEAATSNPTLVLDAAPAPEAHGEAAAGSIYVDHVTAMLLRGRFDVETEGGRQILYRESAAREPARTLLGRPTPCVGRERELSMLAAIFEECVTEPVASAVIVTGAPGVGKSRLRYEFLRRLEERGERIEVWTGRGDPMSAGSPFAMIAQALWSAAGLSEGEPLAGRRKKLEARVLRHTPPDDAARVIDFLGELVGVPFPDEASPQLLAARRDPILMGGQVRRAWEDFVAAECAAHPLVLVLEDLHWGDLPTVRLIDASLRARDRRLLVVAFARPDVDDLFPRLWSERRVQPLPLSELSARSTERLVRRVLGDDAHPEVVGRIVERAQGNAFHAEELIRAVVEGRADALPETVLAMTQARLDALPLDARRVLRAASVFGQSFSLAGVSALLGGRDVTTLGDGAPAPGSVGARIDALVEAEFLARRPGSLGPVHAEIVFRHAFVRDAAYATLTASDRALGHRLAGAWLERQGDADPLVLAAHFEIGADRERAAKWYAIAAAGALESNDFAAAGERAARGRASGAAGASRGHLFAIEVEAAFWQGAMDDGIRAATLALDALSVGTEDYCRVISRLITMHGRAGRAPEVLGLVDQLALSVEQGLMRPEAARLAACGLAEAVSQLFYFGKPERIDAIAALAARAYGDHADPAVAAWLLELSATRALARGDAAEGLELTLGVAAAFTAHGDLRQACVEESYVAYSYLEMGIYAEAERHAREALALAERMGLSWVVDVLKHTLGFALARLGQLEEGARVERESVEGTRLHGHKRLECDGTVYLALIVLAKGDLESAEAIARRAVEMSEPGSPWAARALAGLASVHLAQGRTEEALEASTRAFHTLAGVGVVDSLGGLVHLVYADACHLSGDVATARSVAVAARDALAAAAAKITRPDWRRRYLEDIPEHARLWRLAEDWSAEGA